MKLSPKAVDVLMAAALEQAQIGAQAGEVPVGAVVAVLGSGGPEIVASAHNEVEAARDASAHAEVLAIRRASAQRHNWRLEDAVLCVTLEPCTMCVGAISLARVGTVIFGARDPHLGALGSLYDLGTCRQMASTRVIADVRAAECAELLDRFFGEIRTKIQAR